MSSCPNNVRSFSAVDNCRNVLGNVSHSLCEIQWMDTVKVIAPDAGGKQRDGFSDVHMCKLKSCHASAFLQRSATCPSAIVTALDIRAQPLESARLVGHAAQFEVRHASDQRAARRRARVVFITAPPAGSGSRAPRSPSTAARADDQASGSICCMVANRIRSEEVHGRCSMDGALEYVHRDAASVCQSVRRRMHVWL